MIICHAPSRANDGESYLQGEVFMQAEFTFIEKEISYNRKCYVGGKFMQAGIFLIEILDKWKCYTGGKFIRGYREYYAVGKYYRVGNFHTGIKFNGGIFFIQPRIMYKWILL